MSLSEFINLVKESNYDLAKIYEQDPNGVYISFLILLALILIVVFIIRNFIKTSCAVNLVSKIQSSKDINDYDSKLSKLVSELPKRGLKLASSLNDQKNEILKQELALLKGLDLKEKISRYEQISAQYAQMAQNSKKFKIDEFTSFYEEKSKSLLSKNLKEEIEKYYINARFDENDIENVNAIVAFANRTSNPAEYISPLQKEINRFSYGFNLEFYKFFNSLDKNKATNIYKDCEAKFKDLLINSGVISERILSYMLENDKKEEVYMYLSSCENKAHLKALYNTMFSKTEDIDLDLAFVSNNTNINVDFKSHIDNRLTDNWKDLEFLKHVINSNGVLETIGHVDYRNVLDRIEKLETQDENQRQIAEALATAKRAEVIALEAKTLARSK